jgi:2-polyprenyl-3-methyl-5-hydroxy-6-metoxy-1,4-benzoquinol methylase
VDYDQIEREEAPQALRLARWITRRLKPRSIIDIGCATGFYLLPFGPEVTCQGIEINEEALAQSYRSLHIERVDIASEKFTRGRFDLGLCLEVLEHIPTDKSDAAVRNIAKLCRTLVFSAAQPGQGGDGHINCQRREYWIAAFSGEGMFYDEAETQDLIHYMARGYHMGWLVNNVMILTGRW